MTRAAVGMCFHRTFEPTLVTELARTLDGRADELWVIEDCFYTSAPTLAAAALAVTDDLTVGVGILPARVRTAAVTAMELATLSRLAPGRLIGGIGHGVQEWMAQMGVRPASPLTALEEVMSTVRRLLDGEEVTFAGRYVTLDGVRLDQPPVPRPAVLAGVRGPRSMAVAGRSADGVVLADAVGPAFLPRALAQAGHPEDFQVAVFAALITAPTRREAYREAAPWLAEQLDRPTPSLTGAAFYDELVALRARGGTDALASLPPQWWAELGAIGTLDDAAAHIQALHRAGATSVALFPSPDPDRARAQAEDVVRLAAG